MKERTIIEEWDGPVVANDDRWFESIDECVEWFWDDCYNAATERANMDDVPEFVECCDDKLPTFSGADSIIENIAENHPMAEDCPNFADSVSPEKEAELNQLVNNWIKSVNWTYWTPNKKFILLRPLVEEYEKANQHTQMMHQAMDYAGS